MDETTRWLVAILVVDLRLLRIAERSRLETLQDKLDRAAVRRVLAVRRFRATLLEHQRKA